MLGGNDVDGDALAFVVGKDLPNDNSEAGTGLMPRYGKISGTAPNLLYTAPAGYIGRDVFTFYVSDGKTTSQQGDEIALRVDGLRDAEGKALRSGTIQLVAR